MGSETERNSKYATILVISLYVTMAQSTKLVARPVQEVSNEPSRIDDKRPQNLGFIPFSNPLSGNSQQKAKLHIQNQQAMYNAEKIRQHRAQLQRWTKAPPKMDSYMKAYRESQENLQLALEQQQSNVFNGKRIDTRSISPKLNQGNSKQGKTLLDAEPIKITKEDAIIRPQVNRNHRSYGSISYEFLQPKKLNNIFIAPGPTYDQGVTIKPNSNIGLANVKTAQESTKLFTQAIPSQSTYVLEPHHYNLQSYASEQDMNALNYLLTKSPYQYVTEHNTLTESEKHHSDFNEPIDLKFYAKDAQILNDNYLKYAHAPSHHESSVTRERPVKDFVPITEEVDDVADPNDLRVKPIALNPTLTQSNNMETTTTKSNNYYKVEVASQTIESGYKQPQESKVYYEEEKPEYKALQYLHQPLSYVAHSEKPKSDLNKKYLHHNAQNTGVLHLNGDGTGVSAYGDESLQYAAKYEFGYRVQDLKTGNDFGHHEAKSGDSTKGHYHVLLPDGRMQKVRYSAGPEGYHADISYDHLIYKYT